MDKIKYQMIQELKKDARISFSKISRKLGVSPQTILNRYNEMKSKKEIKTCSIIIDLTKLGYIGTAHLLLKISPLHDPTIVINKVNKISNVIIASTALGDYEGYAVIATTNMNDLYKKIIEIRNIQGISTLEFFIAIPGFKYFPPTGSQNLDS